MKRFVCSLAILSVLIFATPAQEGLSPAQASLVAAERAFAKLSVEKGVREAFITWFADDGINFQPHPVNTKEAYGKLPAPASPPPVVLNWSPIHGDVSRAGDLGYSTGPFTLEDHGPRKQPTGHGAFFSIWKKQADGAWRVALDLGVRTDSPVAPLDAPFRAARPVKAPVKATASGSREQQLDAIKALDRTAFACLSKAKEFLSLAEDGVRVYRQQRMPLVGKDAVRAWFAKTGRLITVEPDSVAVKTIGADVARSGDLAYSYGSYEMNRRGLDNRVVEKGYYARIWRRDGKGNWRIAFDVHLPLPREEK